jgi:hypothetical protein
VKSAPKGRQGRQARPAHRDQRVKSAPKGRQAPEARPARRGQKVKSAPKGRQDRQGLWVLWDRPVLPGSEL